jgi:hypothetical protein
MTRRHVLWLIGVVFLVGSAVGLYLGIQKFQHFTLTGGEIQQRIDKKLPHTTKNNVTVNSMHIELLKEGISLRFNAEGKRLRQEFNVTAHAMGKLNYDAHKGAFHFYPQNIEVEELAIRGGDVSDKVEKFIDKWVMSDKIVARKDVISSKVEEWVYSLIEGTARTALKNMAVYTLPDNLKGNVVRMMLTSVETQEGVLTAHLSFWQFTKMIIFYLVVLVAAIGFLAALLMNPELGIAVLAINSLGDGS